jgi:hypothetical protein
MAEYKISNIFDGIGVKRLSLVEIDKATSNQHELNGVKQFSLVFGQERLENIPAKFLYLSDNEEEFAEDTGRLTWYDARERHPTRSEYRLYFSPNDCLAKAMPEDLLVIARFSSNSSAVVIVAKKDSTIENQIIWLFGFGEEDLQRFYVKNLDPATLDNIDFASEIILRNIGIELPVKEEALSDYLISKYRDEFPKTRIFSHEVYDYLNKRKIINLREDPDRGVSKLLQTEEACFKNLEKVYVQEKLDKGFFDVEDFINYSLSVQNRRKSRAGYSFENQLEMMFKENSVQYDRGKMTENKSKPDFIFPGIKEYHDTTINPILLNMLGVKTTCKDRWRQILTEADRIETKHLATLEPSISQNQTDEMENRNVILVLPSSLHETYNSKQRKIIVSIKEFVEQVKKNQMTF